MHRSRRAAALLVAVVLVAGCSSAAAPAPSTATRAPLTPLPVLGDAPPAVPGSPVPSSPPAPATPSPAPGPPFALDLAERGDFVGQYTFEWCVGASLQMALNLVLPAQDRTRATQQRLWELARDLSDSPYGGANPIGWTAALNRLGIGSYELASFPSLEGAVRAAAAALRATGRPVGLVMWRGRHAWVMSGFTGLGDPADGPGFTVTGIRVLDPLYPHGSDTWGPSPRPGSLLTPEELAVQYVPRLRGRVDLGVAPGWLVILPTAA